MVFTQAVSGGQREVTWCEVVESAVDPIHGVPALGKGLGEYPLGGPHAAVQVGQERR